VIRRIPLSAALMATAVLVCLLAPAIASGAASQTTMFDSPIDLLQQGDQQRNFTLDELQRMGVDTVRVLVYWRDIAPSPDSATKPGPPFDAADPTTYPQGPLQHLDYLIAAVEARGMNMHLTVSGPFPRWASEGGASQIENPRPSEYEAFMQALGTRWDGSYDHDNNPLTPPPVVTSWGVWNEPNVGSFLGPRLKGGKLYPPIIYRKLYLAGRQGLIDRGHGNDRILIGETGPRGSKRAIPPLRFLRETLCLDDDYKPTRHCAMLPADGWATHPYSYRKTPWQPSDYPDDLSYGNLPKLVKALDRAAAAGRLPPDLPVYETEYGIQSKPDPYSGVSLQQQAEYLAIAEYLAYRNPRIESYSQYLMRDDPPDISPTTPYGGFETGLRLADGTLKPSYDEFRLPLVVKRAQGAEVGIWGHVREFAKLGSPPSLAQVRIRIRDPGKQARDLKTVDFDSRGYFSTTGLYRSGREWRLLWDGPGNATIKGPWTRAYAF
jgi:hypothetical protein